MQTKTARLSSMVLATIVMVLSCLLTGCESCLAYNSAREPSPAGLPHASPITGGAGSGPGLPTRAEPPSLYWNGWAAQEGGLSATRTLVPDINYDVYLDLSALDYSEAVAAVESRVPSSEFRTELPSLASTARFEVLLLADTELFEAVGTKPWDADFQVGGEDLERLRRPLPAPGDPLKDESLAHRLGRVMFKVRPKRAITTTRRTSLAFSIWRNDRPIDDFEISVCVSPRADTSCAELPTIWKGRPNGATLHAAAAPAAALQFIEYSDGIWGLFREEGQSLAQAVKWNVSRSGSHSLRNDVVNVLTQLERSPADRWEKLGQTLINIVFPPNDTGSTAKAAFVDFAARAIQKAQPRREKPRLVVRTTGPMVIPLGFATVPVGGKAQFLGEHFALDVPLQRMSAPKPSATPCDLSWVSVLPPPTPPDAPADAAMKAVRERLALRKSKALSLWATGSPPACVFTSLNTFADWAQNSYDSSATAPSRIGLLLISHHDTSRTGGNMLHFSDDQQESLVPATFNRRFTPGSVALLNACGSGKPTALGFVEKLNQRGFDSIVATAIEVEPLLAADFTYCLAAQLDIAQQPTPFGRVFDDTIACLRKLDGGTHGARAFSYTLLGSRTSTICPQPKVEQCR